MPRTFSLACANGLRGILCHLPTMMVVQRQVAAEPARRFAPQQQRQERDLAEDFCEVGHEVASPLVLQGEEYHRSKQSSESSSPGAAGACYH